MLECGRRSHQVTSDIRVRYAPSPTGEPHVGNIRTAVFNWLFARHYGGAFIIRVEDTDQARRVEGATEELLESLRWLGIEWDEGPDIGGDYGPYYQSQRLDLYRDAIDDLLENGRAYRCYCTTERLAEMREAQAREKRNTGYDRRCRYLRDEERAELEPAGAPSVVRFKMPTEGVTTLNDEVRGHVSFENSLVDDFVMLKSDGFPTYHLANVIDDHHMGISHVLRAEEWLPSTPRHLQLYESLNWEPPHFAHLPIILAPDRSKLSKRHGATAVLEYRRMGYLPEAMVNFLTLLGWSLDDKTEIIPIRELVEQFTVERVGKAGAVFNTEKLDWMNGHYTRQMSHGQLADTLMEHWQRYPPAEIAGLPDRDYLQRIVPLIQERMKTMEAAAPLIGFFFRDDVEYQGEELLQKGMDEAGTRAGLKAALQSLSALPSFGSDVIEGSLRQLAQDLDVKAGQLFGSLRIATTGLKVAPPLFQTMEVLGQERTLRSIERALEKLSV